MSMTMFDMFDGQQCQPMQKQKQKQRGYRGRFRLLFFGPFNVLFSRNLNRPLAYYRPLTESGTLPVREKISGRPNFSFPLSGVTPRTQ